ncbi:hypothetical protein BDZ45DRAFT_745462 [Acephala macrosclerotiorum]|nr:hypothetical protein BDZ45DRAFT_745462 [Acephala macrosclerotiorum]
MSKLLVAMLLFATLTAAFKETINIYGPGDHDTVNKLYQAFGGSWNLSLSGIEGFEQAAISQLTFHPWDSDSTGYDTNSSSISNARRRAVTPEVKAPSCYNQNDGHYSLFTVQQQQWITEAVCNEFLQAATPYAFAGLGILVNGVGCTTITNPLRNTLCTVIVTMMVTAGGVYFQPQYANVCLANFNAIERSCGQSGGAVDSELTTTSSFRNGQSVIVTTITSTIWATESLDETLSDDQYVTDKEFLYGLQGIFGCSLAWDLVSSSW